MPNEMRLPRVNPGIDVLPNIVSGRLYQVATTGSAFFVKNAFTKNAATNCPGVVPTGQYLSSSVVPAGFQVVQNIVDSTNNFAGQAREIIGYIVSNVSNLFLPENLTNCIAENIVDIAQSDEIMSRAGVGAIFIIFLVSAFFLLIYPYSKRRSQVQELGDDMQQNYSNSLLV